MNTISVTVEQTNHTYMLAELLKNIRFVLNVNVAIDKSASRNAKEIKKY